MFLTGLVFEVSHPSMMTEPVSVLVCNPGNALLIFRLGGGASLGQFKVLPQYCGSLETCKTVEDDRTVDRVEGSQKATPGYFSIGLASGITTEVTTTHHAALHRFRFTDVPSHTNDTAVLLFDLTNDLSRSFGGDGTLDVTINSSPGTVRVRGGGSYSPSFGTGSYMVRDALYCTLLDLPLKLNARSTTAWTFPMLNPLPPTLEQPLRP